MKTKHEKALNKRLAADPPVGVSEVVETPDGSDSTEVSVPAAPSDGFHSPDAAKILPDPSTSSGSAVPSSDSSTSPPCPRTSALPFPLVKALVQSHLQSVFEVQSLGTFGGLSVSSAGWKPVTTFGRPSDSFG